MLPDRHDARSLGVAVSHLRLDEREIDLDELCQSDGWHAREPDWCWTNGDALIATHGARLLCLEVVMTGRYWLDDNPSDVRVA
jgi:hypothetical protein